MAATKQDFEGLVRAYINRGAAMDAQISTAVAGAIQAIELEHDLEYLHKIKRLLRDPAGSAAEQSTTLPLGNYLKKLQWVQRSSGVTEPLIFVPISRVGMDAVESYPQATLPDWAVQSYDVDPVGGGAPQWLLRLGSSSFPNSFYIDISAKWFTDYTALPSNGAHWLLLFGEKLVLGKTLLDLSSLMRWGAREAEFVRMTEDGRKSMVVANEELKQSPVDVLRMPYSGEW